jgi:hypothetical protein
MSAQDYFTTNAWTNEGRLANELAKLDDYAIDQLLAMHDCLMVAYEQLRDLKAKQPQPKPQPVVKPMAVSLAGTNEIGDDDIPF